MKIHYYKDDILEICDDMHLTVEEIFLKLSEMHPEVGKSSIYRNVEEMVKSGDLRKVVGIGKKSYFEKNKGQHIHLIDVNTGEIIDLPDDIQIKNLPKNFSVTDMDVKIFGKFSS